MGSGFRTNIVCAIAVALLSLARLGEAGAVSAAPDQYDPRRDPNYTSEASQTAPIHWEAVWGLVREFEERTHANAGRNQLSSQYAVPQPWHYVQEIPSPGATPPFSGASVYGGSYGGPFYGYEPWYPSWREASPRIPWWSLIPPRTHHDRHHHRGHAHQHQGSRGHHRQ